MDRAREYRKKVWEQTIRYCKKQTIRHPRSEKIDEWVPIPESSLSHTEPSPVQVSVRNMDLLHVALEESQKEGTKPCILHTCHPTIRGGYVREGSLGLEEDIFRRTDSFTSHPKTFYPLRLGEFIYVPEVHILRDHMYEQYRFYKMWHTVAMISTPCLWRPELVEGRLIPEDKEILRDILEKAFRLAISKQHDVIVMNAFGCGTTRIPKEDVVEQLGAVLSTYRYHLKHVLISVIDSELRDYLIQEFHLE